MNQDIISPVDQNQDSSENIVDRTQQLIDEVNKLLESSPAPAPAPPVSNDSPVAVEPVAAEPETAEPEAVELSTPVVDETEAVATAEPMKTVDETIANNSAAANNMRSFLDGLMGSEGSSEDSAVDAETSAVDAAVDTVEAVDAVEEDTTSESADAGASAEYNADDLSQLFATSVASTDEADSVTEPEATSDVETSSDEEPSDEEPSEEVDAEAMQYAAESIEEVSVEAEADVEVASVEDETAAEADVEEVNAEEEVSVEAEISVEDSAEESEEQTSESNFEPQSFTEKYLAGLQDSGDEDLEPEVTAEVKEEVAEVQPWEDPFSEEDDEPAELSVESWMAKNIGTSSDSESEEAEAEEVVAEETSSEEESLDDTENEPVAESSQEDSTEVDAEIEAEVEAEVAAETSVYHTPTEGLSEESALLEAAFGKKLQQLETTIGNMFASLSSQIETFSGVAGEPVEISAPAPAVVANSADQADSSSCGSETELQEKLRKAEIELSISRAKVSQERAQLEQLQADLERREAALGSKKAGSKKSGGLMDRWKKHMG